MDVAAAARAAPQGARHRAPAARDPARPRRRLARGRHGDRSGADAGRLAGHGVDPAPARDRDPRRAHHVGRRSAQRAAAHPRPRAVSPGEPVRAPPVRLEGRAAGRARGAARSSRRSDGRLAEGLAARRRRGVRSARLRRRRRVARVAAAAGADRERQGGAAHLVPVRAGRTARDHRRSRARGRQGEAGGRPARARPRPSLGPRRLAKRGDAARGVHAQSRLHDEGRRAARSDQFHADPARSDASASGFGADRFRPAAARSARGLWRAPAAAGEDPCRPRALRAAGNADAGPPAMGGADRIADRLFGFGRVHEAGHDRPGCPPRGDRRFRPLRIDARTRRGQIGQQQRRARSAAGLSRSDCARHRAGRREVGAPRGNDHDSGRAARVRERRCRGQCVGDLSHRRAGTRRNRFRRQCHARRCAAGRPLPPAIDRRRHAQLVAQGARQRRGGRCTPEGRGQPRRFSVRAGPGRTTSSSRRRRKG